MQVVLLKLPPETLAVHVTVPLGADFVPLSVSVTVALREIDVPTFKVDLLGDTLVLVLR